MSKAKQDIKGWFEEGKDFKQGVAIYKRYGSGKYDHKLEQQLKRPYPQKFWRDKLENELKKIRRSLPKTTPPPSAAPTQATSTEVLKNPPSAKNINTSSEHPRFAPVENLPSRVRFQNAPFEVRLLYTQYIQLAKEKAAIHARLRLLPPSKRFDACIRILDCAKEEDQIWDKIRDWQRTGDVPGVEGFQPVVESIVKNIKRYNTLATYLSRYPKQIQKAKDKKDYEQVAKLEKLYEDKKNEHQKIKAALNL